MHDNVNGNGWPARVRRKGVEEGAVKWAVDKFDEVGYIGQTVTFKSDQEEAIKAYKKRRSQQGGTERRR